MTNFTETFSKIGNIGIKRMPNKGKVDNSRVSIVQASDLKEILEELKVKRDEVTISSVGTINMYPSIKLSKMKRAIRFFARKLTTATKKTLQLMPGYHPLRNELQPNLLRQQVIRVSRR